MKTLVLIRCFQKPTRQPRMSPLHAVITGAVIFSASLQNLLLWGRCVDQKNMLPQWNRAKTRNWLNRPSCTRLHAGWLTKVVCTPLVPPVSRNTRGCTPRGYIVRTWPFLLQILPNCSPQNCSQCIFIIGLLYICFTLSVLIYEMAYAGNELCAPNVRVGAHMVHTWCTQKYQKKYS